MLREVCVENFTAIPKAIKQGANRIELCDNLAVGGTTVSLGVMEQTVDYCHSFSIPVMVIIRPRGGNFVYDETEKSIMLRDIELANQAGANGIVIGALTAENQLDQPFLSTVLKNCGQMDVTFHMAFDEIAPRHQAEAINWLSEAGFSRILTHGGKMDESIESHLKTLKELIAHANDRIIIMPGGGITDKNAAVIQEALGVTEIHGTKIVGVLD